MANNNAEGNGGDLFSSLPDISIKEIFEYAGSPFDLLSCERTCRRFRDIVAEDDVWKVGEYDRRKPIPDIWPFEYIKSINEWPFDVGDSYRERSCINSTLLKVRYEQRFGVKNIILSVLSPDTIRTIIRVIINDNEMRDQLGLLCNAQGLTFGHEGLDFEIRGDTLGYLVELIQDLMIRKLESVMLISVHVSKVSGKYPILTVEDKSLCERIQIEQKNDLFRGLGLNLGHAHVHDRIAGILERECSDGDRFRLVRRLANRSGVVKMTDQFMEEAFYDVFILAIKILVSPMICHSQLTYGKSYEVGESIDLWNDIPPTMKKNNGRHHCVIVPRQISESAKQLGLIGDSTDAVYGQEWVVSQGQNLEEEISRAKERYFVKGVLLEDDSSDDFMSLEDSVVDGEFSVYDDEECPDEGISSEEED